MSGFHRQEAFFGELNKIFRSNGLNGAEAFIQEGYGIALDFFGDKKRLGPVTYEFMVDNKTVRINMEVCADVEYLDDIVPVVYCDDIEIMDGDSVYTIKIDKFKRV